MATGSRNFVAAALTESPLCGLKLGDRNSLTGVVRERAAGIRIPRSSSAAVPPVSWAGVAPPLRLHPLGPVPRFTFSISRLVN